MTAPQPLYFTSPVTDSRLLIRRSFVALCCTLASARGVSAQRILGPWDDAWTLPSGALRIGLAPQFLSASERFGLAGRESLGAPYSGALGATTLPSFQLLDNTIGALSGISAFRATIGTARADVRHTSAIIPLELALGVTRRLTLHAFVPFNTGQNEIEWLLDGSTASVGANPALGANGAPSSNGALLDGLGGAANSLEQLADACAANASADPRCGQVSAEMDQVRALIAQARQVSDGLAETYGGREGTQASLFVPLAGSAAQTAILAQIEALRGGFSRYGTASVSEGAGPAGAAAPATITELNALLTDSTYGYVIGPFKRRYQQAVGDIDVGVSLLVYDGLRTDNAWLRDTSRHSLALRQSFGFTYRIGTGTPADPDDPLRVPTGDAQNDLEFTSATDIITGRHLWTSVIVRWTMQQSLDGIARIPDGSGSPFIPLARRRLTRTEMGNRLSIEAAPRWVLNDYFGGGLHWRYTRTDGATLTELAPFAGPVPMRYAAPAVSAHEIGFGFTWSSLAAWRARRSRWPLELQWDHSLLVRGSGNMPILSADRISLRAYARLWGPGR
jgi:hypothetical protein